MTKHFSWELFNRIPVVGILRNVAIEDVKVLAGFYQESGLTTIEVTMNSAGAAEMISHLSGTYSGKLNIGAGTVCTMADLDEALSAGATFVVTPIVNEEVIKTCVAKDIPVFPGAFTPTEIYKAWSLGAEMIKVFPATQLGATYIKDVLAPLPQVKLIPTGGVSLENFADFLKAGAKGLGMGSTLFPQQLIKEKNWEELENLFAKLVEKYGQYVKKTGAERQMPSDLLL
jgi:2-dehydro-3-deoxyphosphogluconate aldolase/(4S)-4-hydroxy-2-oxoglutarate aldolase